MARSASANSPAETPCPAAVLTTSAAVTVRETVPSEGQTGVPAGAVHTNRGVIEDAQLQHRGHFVYLDHPAVGRHPVQRSEFRLSQAAAEHRWAAPLIGQHTAQVCKEILGMSEDEIATLMAEGVLEDSILPEGGAV